MVKCGTLHIVHLIIYNLLSASYLYSLYLTNFVD